MNLVFDTNVYLAAMGKKGGVCHRAFMGSIDAGNTLYISPEIIGEIAEKSIQLIKAKYIRRDEFQTIVKMVFKKIRLVVPRERLKVVQDDPDDDKILECAAAANADLIITMDHHLLKLKRFRTSGIIHPETFLYSLPVKN